MEGNISVRAQRPVPPWAATISADTDRGSASLDVELMPAEPEDAWDAKLVGQRHGLSVELRFVWSHSEQAGELNVKWQFQRATGAVEERAGVLGLLIALHGEGTVEIRDREEQRPEITERTASADLPTDLLVLQRAFEDLATIQRFAAATFGPPPEEITSEEASQLAWLAQALVAGGYDGTISSVTMRCDAEAVAAFKRSGSDVEVRETLVAGFFERELPVAERSVKLPLVVVKQAVRVPGPEPLWEVELVPSSSDSAPVHFALTPLDQRSERDAA